MTPSAVPVVEGLFEAEAGVPRLNGSRCVGCGAVYFPASSNCRNPECHDPHVAPALIGGRGELYSYTVQNYRPPPLFQMEPWAPYAIGLVDLADGLRVMAMLSVPVEDIHIGMPVRLAVRTLFNTNESGEVTTHVFVADIGRGAVS